MLTLQQFIDECGGSLKLAREMNLTRNTVNYWYLKKNYPNVKVMFKLIKLSKNRLSFDSIIKSCTPAKSKH